MILEDVVETNYKKEGNTHQRCVTCAKEYLKRFRKTKVEIPNENNNSQLESSIDDLLSTITMKRVYTDSDSNKKVL